MSHASALFAASGPMPFAEPGVKRHYAPDRAVRIEHIDVHLSVDPEQRTFSGQARLRVVPLASFAGRFAFDLDEVALVSVTDGAGQALAHRFGDGQLEIVADPVPAEVVVRWEGSDPQRGLYFTGPTEQEPQRQHMAWTQCQDEDGHFVFPCHDHPGVKHTWGLTLEAPEGYTVLSSGGRRSVEVVDGRVVGRFEVSQPMPAYLVSFVAARLTEVQARDVGEVSVRYFVPEGAEEPVERSFGRTPEMIEHFSAVTGIDYPWPRYDQVVVHDFIFGGMENVGCTTMADILLVDEKAQLEWPADSLVSHELAHQWFGDFVTCRDWSQGWLNESWATYMEAVWWEHAFSAEETIWYRHETAKGYLGEASSRYQRPIVSYDFRAPLDVFDRHLYNKGSCVLWTLRHELGDEAFWGATEAYLRANANGSVHTRDFQHAFEAHTGRNLDGFFHQWLHCAGHPKLEVTLGRDDGLVTVKVVQTQKGDGVPEAYELQLRLELVSADGVRTVTLPVKERERTWALPTDTEVQHVRVDPGYRMLAEITLDGPSTWLEPLLADPCPVLAVRAAKALLDDGRLPSVDAVRKAARSHPFDQVRGAIAGLLGKRGTPDDRDVLVAMLADDRSARARRAAAAALGAFRDEVAADALLAALEGEPETWQLHGALLASLGRTRDPRAREVLTSHLDTDSWGDLVRQRALVGLADTDDVAVLPTLLEASRTGSARVRFAAAQGLASLAERHHELRPQVIERLQQMLVEPGFRTQNGAIAALGSLGDARAQGALARMHRTAADGRTRRMAYEALVKVRKGAEVAAGVEALQRRLDALADDNRSLRQRLDKLERGVS
jgi:aminopeptidase N